ncbi:DUF1878 family protein [Alkalihalobacterium elongatum]|uniref:DUF1878 family protein n=1 Tax=Alkalihalobacterium elongatum TaxID=2675466 RepID=UPI001C1F2F7D|nr:DUF1878 family protein [Alkalihalobacterium elongatum]
MKVYDEDYLNKLKFQHSLLLKMIDKNSFPFFSLALEKDLSEREVEQVLTLCEELQKKYEEQCELGFVHHTPLLVHFVGMLPEKLPISETLSALKAQSLYTDLIEVLQKAEKRIQEE